MATIGEDAKVCKDCKWCDIVQEIKTICIPELQRDRKERVILVQGDRPERRERVSDGESYNCGKRFKDLVTGRYFSARIPCSEMRLGAARVYFCGSEGKFYEEG